MKIKCIIPDQKGLFDILDHLDDIDELIGIELDQSHYNGHNGKGYFRCPDGRGYFVKLDDICEILPISEKLTWEQLQLQRQTNIRELTKQLRKTSMIAQREKYGSKLNYVQQQELLKKTQYEKQLQALQQALADNTHAMHIDDFIVNNIPMNQERDEYLNSNNNVTIGDRVKMARGNTGIVKFMGQTQFAKGEVIGLQLDRWTAAGHTGTDGKGILHEDHQFVILLFLWLRHYHSEIQDIN